ncbi:MAG: cytochrome C [Rhizobiales bacterium]|nr:cytochrome C [Hyphomicrobiales bacterium]
MAALRTVAAVFAAAGLAGGWIEAQAQSMPQSAPPGALACGGCHPASSGGLVPPLAGMPAADISQAMLAFRTGTRPATVMDRIAKGFSEDEIKALAAWFAREKPP